MENVAAPPEAATAGKVARPAAVYAARRDYYAALRDDDNRRRYLAANLSVLTFFALVGLGIIALIGHAPLAIALALAALVAFVYAFRRQGQLDERHNRHRTLVALNEEGLARLRRDWDAIPLPALAEATSAVPEHLYAGDIDLLGRASLQHLLSTASTPAAQLRLRDWILAPADPAVVRERQAAARELAPNIETRQELTLFGRLSGMTPGAYERFLAWAERGPWLARRPALLGAARVVPALAVLSLLANLTGLIAYPVWLAFVALNIAITYAAGKRVEQILDEVAERQVVFLPYASIFALIARQPFQSPLLRRVQADLAAERVNADAQMRRLAAIMRFGDLRLSLLFPILQAFLLWNVHTLSMLERWQSVAGPHVRRWLERLAEIEALAALGAVAFENPDWAFPAIVEGRTPELVARGLGHPLLPPDVVGNDVTIGPPGTFLLVTGSNMSGKSTLLRAVGVNVTLAQMGGPVCAASLSLPPVALATSMRISDSLEYGVSYFMAELRRLKLVVDDADRAAAEGSRTPLFLLDEILHGTNTRERQIAVRQIIRHLLAVGAIGAVSTHDLTLAELPEIKAVAQQVHFTERFTRGPDGKPEMSFDYRLRPGLAPSTNALTLMEIVGLPIE